MLQLSATAMALLADGRHTPYVAIDSWLGEDLLYDDLPIIDGSAVEASERRKPSVITFSLPLVDHNNFCWVPYAADHPIGRYGQMLRVELGLDLGNGQREVFQRGWFVIDSIDTEGDTVRVTAIDALLFIEEARFVSPFQPQGNFEATFKDLVEPALTVDFSGDLVDRTVPGGVNITEDRLAALYEVADALPAEVYVNEQGSLAVVPVSDGSSVLDLYEPIDQGDTGTITRVTANMDRSRIFNVIVARGRDDVTQAEYQGVAYDSLGPTRFDGPFNPLGRTFFHESPLLNSNDAAQKSANTTLSRLKRESSLGLTVVAIRHPALQVGDVLTIHTKNFGVRVCSIERMTLPYGPDVMTLELREVTA